MGSIRSLATIAILGVVAVFLYVKINEAPMPGGQQGQTAPGVPPLTGLNLPSTPPGSYDATGGSEAPAWSAPAATAPAYPAATPPVGASAGAVPPNVSTSVSTELPPIPAIPDMPDLPDLSSSPSAMPAVPAPTGLPASVPTAQYADTPSTPEGISGSVPSLGTSTPNLASSQSPPVAAPPTPGMPAVPAIAPASENNGLVAVDAASLPGAPATAAPAASMPAAPSAPPFAAQRASDDNRYGEDSSAAPLDAAPASAAPVSVAPLSAAPPAAAPASAPEKLGVSSLAEGWPAIQAALDRGELARAHLLLSQWYAEPSLTPAESQQVETLLGQLAGTVVYSTEHQLEPAYVVQPGETLETIAQKYNVPWQLLAKINGIPAANQVRPGQTLKVVRGPFSAIVELDRQQLTLMLDGRYAGKFPILVPPGATLPAGQWVVQEKPASPVQQASPYAAAASPALPGVARSLQLRNVTTTDPTNGGIEITIGSAPAMGAAGMASGQEPASPYLVKVAPRDAEELADILSVGSTVVIQR